MMKLALGLIETKGLVPAIEAADTALKAAEVKLVACEFVKGGLVTIELVGDVAAVKAAVDAGGEAAARIGTLLSKHVIARPDEYTEMLIYPPDDKKGPYNNDDGKNIKQEEEIEVVVEDVEVEITEEETDAPEVEVVEKIETPEVVETEAEAIEVAQEAEGQDLQSMSVVKLRRLARKTPGIAIQGREISRATKGVLIREINKAMNKIGG